MRGEQPENSGYLGWAVLLGILFGGIFLAVRHCHWIGVLFMVCVGAVVVLLGALTSDLNSDEKEAAEAATNKAALVEKLN